jgi:hypothetical protein
VPSSLKVMIVTPYFSPPVSKALAFCQPTGLGYFTKAVGSRLGKGGISCVYQDPGPSLDGTVLEMAPLMLNKLGVGNFALPALDHEVAVIHYYVFDRHGMPFVLAI